MKLGQHMVIDRALLRRIVRYAELSGEDVVLEVGCGTGNLTRYLLRHAGKVIGIEKDVRLAEKLRRKFADEIEEGRFELIVGDALKVDFPGFNKFVANIPFSISSPLTFKLLRHDFELAVVMYQREFAERLVGEDSRLGVIAKAYCRAEILEYVKPHAFKPRPKVESAVVRIVKEPVVHVSDLELFEKIVTFAFTMRRKKMGNILAELAERHGIVVEVDEDVAGRRPEELGAEKFAELCLRARRRQRAPA
ncbi:MAG: 16S rRNA (adenine(1518)-N(6)/adenine(1519)-N(6))-dimethyltransferase RsmA [Archaeoglobaceae archaeon]